ncbi:uncharacterized protein LOC132727882 [Ruditapes philippinarum]|uniref:uncharacterized protein LOC132727882 n=1 Tax=Ruditapes philippinarum TaxID=129788 RepID=UPI00295A7B95|nr:uncharacterized protein LOC132727882 [Ruditapes philippinarum]
MGNDNLSIVSFNSSRKGLLTLSPDQRPSYLQRIFQSSNAKPDICFLPGDDKYAKLNAIRGYDQFTVPNSEDTVVLFDVNRVKMEKPKVSFNSFGQLPGLDFDKLVVPQVEVSTLQPYKQVVKEFSMISWKYGYFQSTGFSVETLMESLITFSQRLAITTGKPVLIGGEMNIEYSTLMKIVKKLSTDQQEEFLANMQPVMCEQGFLPSMTKSSLRDIRHLFMMNVFQCKSTSSNGVIKTWEDRQRTEIVPDCFIASKHLKLAEASLLDVEEVTGRQICMSLLQKHKPTQTSMEIPVRPPKHHGG